MQACRVPLLICRSDAHRGSARSSAFTADDQRCSVWSSSRCSHKLRYLCRVRTAAVVLRCQRSLVGDRSTGSVPVQIAAPDPGFDNAYYFIVSCRFLVAVHLFRDLFRGPAARQPVGEVLSRRHGRRCIAASMRQAVARAVLLCRSGHRRDRAPVYVAILCLTLSLITTWRRRPLPDQSSASVTGPKLQATDDRRHLADRDALTGLLEPARHRAAL